MIQTGQYLLEISNDYLVPLVVKKSSCQHAHFISDTKPELGNLLNMSQTPCLLDLYTFTSKEPRICCQDERETWGLVMAEPWQESTASQRKNYFMGFSPFLLLKLPPNPVPQGSVSICQWNDTF